MPISIQENDKSYQLDMTYDVLLNIIKTYNKEKERLRAKALRQYYEKKPANYERYGKCKKPKEIKIESAEPSPATHQILSGQETA